MKTCLLLLTLLLPLLPARAQRATPATAPLDVAALDATVVRTLRAFDVPGLAVAVVKDGQVVLAKGYGVRSLATRAPVDANTAFGIASNSKAFTTAALGLLVDEGRLRWDDKVTDYIPEFKLYDPYATAEFTVRDLLCHRSGLGLGAGDLMFFPDSADFTMADVIHNLRYFRPASSFRSTFAYDNNLYLVAAEVVRRVSGRPFTSFVEARLLRPLGMAHSAANYARLPDPANAIDAHAEVDGRVQVVRRMADTVGVGAGNMYCSAADMSRWALMLLGGPGAPAPLLRPATQRELWTSQTVAPGWLATPGYHSHFTTYGLGWFLQDALGYQEVLHTGGEIGMVSKVVLLPELRLGIIVLTNQESGAAYRAVSSTIEDYYLGLTGRDRVQEQLERRQAAGTMADQATAAVWRQVALATKTAPRQPDYAPYLGRYHDAWLGDVLVRQQGRQLWLRAVRSPRLVGELLPYRGSTYVVRWRDHSIHADAFATFVPDEQGRAASLQMKLVSPDADFSYDFQDLDLRRVE